MGTIMRVIKGDTRSFDYGSYPKAHAAKLPGLLQEFASSPADDGFRV